MKKPHRAPIALGPQYADGSPSARVFALLTGTWTVSREVTGYGEFEGRASFSPDGARQLAYREAGRFRLVTGTELQAYREYVYLLSGHPAPTIVVLRTEGPSGPASVLHELDFVEDAAGVLTAAHCHRCGRDTYAATFAVTAPDRFELRYRVRGPNKSYDIHSVYVRAQTG